jgi:hypothetical protein
LFTWLVRKGRVTPGTLATCHDKHGYIVIRIDNHLYKAHRLAWLYVYGEFPPDELDHINRHRDDNRISNLRVSNRKHNPKNTGMPRHNTSGVKGVYLHKASGRWHARIYDNNCCISLGFHDTLEKAAIARANAELKYGYRA